MLRVDRGICSSGASQKCEVCWAGSALVASHWSGSGSDNGSQLNPFSLPSIFIS